MPAFADIVIKKADGTTNVTFVGQQRSSGDSSPARYAQTVGYPIPTRRPQLSIAASPYGTSGLVRRIRMDGVFPIVVSVGGGDKVVNVALSGCTVLLPLEAPLSDVTEGVHQLLNAAASAAMKESAISGYAPA